MNQDKVNELFEYKEGILYWRARKDVPNHINTRDIGREAGTLDSARKYTNIEIEGKSYLRHRLIFLMFNGYLPEFVDHIDANCSNDKIENLRAASRSENQANRKININNTSGIKGVTWDNNAGKWRGRISKNGIRKNVGYFNSLKEAEEAMKKAREELHKEFTNHG